MKRIFSSKIALVVLSLIGVIQALLSNIVANQLQEWIGPWTSYVLPIFVLITIGLLIVPIRSQLTPATDVQQLGIDQRQAAYNRRAMLEKVRLIWIDGVLNASLYKETVIALCLHGYVQAIVPPLDLVMRRPRRADQLLPPQTHIVEVFDTVGGALLILGAPGAGKTTLLLELARDLLDRAHQDTSLPIPVVFPLSTWTQQRLPLAEWLVDELIKRYDVSHNLAQAWVTTDTILPLLDGLDEVPLEHRAACVEVINTYRQTHGLLPLVVTSRSADYEALTVKFHLHDAVVAQPLSRTQVREYLRAIGFQIAPSTMSPLWDVLDTPLMLNIVVLT